jgi:hypothetical protein
MNFNQQGRLMMVGVGLTVIAFVGAATARVLLWIVQEGWNFGGWILRH